MSVLNPEYLGQLICASFFNQFLAFLYEGGIGEYEDEAEYAPKGCISFLTIHQSKGLEFPIVVCGSLEAVPRKQHTDSMNSWKTEVTFQNPALNRWIDQALRLPSPFLHRVFARPEPSGLGAQQRGTGPCKIAIQVFRDVLCRPAELEGRANWQSSTFEHVKEINLKREYSFTSHIHCLKIARSSIASSKS